MSLQTHYSASEAVWWTTEQRQSSLSEEQYDALHSTCHPSLTWASLIKKCTGGGKMKEWFTEWDRKFQISQRHCLKCLEFIRCQSPMTQQKKSAINCSEQINIQHIQHLAKCSFKILHISVWIRQNGLSQMSFIGDTMITDYQNNHLFLHLGLCLPFAFHLSYCIVLSKYVGLHT